MKILQYTITRLAILLAVISAAVTAQSPAGKVALTFDDLPYSASSGQPWLPNAQRVTHRILEVLKRHSAPAIGLS